MRKLSDTGSTISSHIRAGPSQLSSVVDVALCSSSVEALILIHGKLDAHQEAALGVLKHAETKLQLSLPEFEYWHEELQQYDEALAGYLRRLDTNPRDHLAMMGQMRCLKALSRWQELLKLGMIYI